MKVTCPISGIVTTLVNPLRGHTIHPHAMLSASITCAQLEDWYLAPWALGDLPETETHLLGCAFVLKLPIESMALPVMDAEKLAKWDKFWSANLEKLAKLAAKLEGRDRKFKHLPRLAVTMDTISALPEWIKNLETEISVSSMPISDKARELNRASYKANSDGSADATKLLAPDQIDQVVRRALNNSPLSNNEQKALPVILSDWALKVTEFPDHTKMRWQRIVQLIFQPDYINKLLMSDIKLDQVRALQDHLMLNTPAHAVGTSHSSMLMSRLDMVIPVMEDFMPEISSRRKGNQEDILAALDGGESAPVARAQTPANSGIKQPSLLEKLAARLAAHKGAKV